MSTIDGSSGANKRFGALLIPTSNFGKKFDLKAGNLPAD
jgi:hypothetical protein